MAARRIGYPYNHWDGNNPELEDNSSLYWSDDTIYLEHYIMVLAIEYMLTNDLVLKGATMKDEAAHSFI